MIEAHAKPQYIADNNKQGAFLEIGGVLMTLCGAIILLATFIPRGAWACNPDPRDAPAKLVDEEDAAGADSDTEASERGRYHHDTTTGSHRAESENDNENSDDDSDHERRAPADKVVALEPDPTEHSDEELPVGKH